MTYTLLWALWILAFVVIEGAAIANTQPGDTLSESFWRWFSIKDKGRAWRLRRILLLAFLAWLVVHFLSGGVFAHAEEARTFHRITIAELATTTHTHAEVVGTVTLVKREADGDVHIRLTDGSSFAIAEIIPELPIPVPSVGQKILARGITRRDRQHGWWELHPLLGWELAK